MCATANRLALAFLVLAAVATTAAAQAASTTGSDRDGFRARWFKRSDHSKAGQPHWITPLATTIPRLEQEFRYYVNWWQPRPRGPCKEA